MTIPNFSSFIYFLLTSVLFEKVGAYTTQGHIGYGKTKLERQHVTKHLNSHFTSNSDDTCANVTEHWFKDAVVDNFSAEVDEEGNPRHWNQRYWLNKQFWGGPGSAIFVFIGGEGQESCSRLTNRMYLFELAEKHNALLVNVEHRYYGESYPTQDMSTSNLKKYLSSDQALADLARLIGALKQSLGAQGSKVMTVGGSYPGNLAAWFRLKYPSVSIGSIASSAPVLAKTNFGEYMDVVGQSLVYFGGQQCFDAFTTAAQQVAKLAEDPSDGYAQLDKDFETCSPIVTEKDLAIFLSDLMGNVQGTVQYNNEHNGVMNVTDICAAMTSPNGSPYELFVNLQKVYRSANGQTCEDASWKESVEYMSNPEKDANNAARPWTFQTCNEFGYYQTTDSSNQPFSSWKWLNLQFSLDICKTSFDWHSEPAVDWTNQKYGDLHIAGTEIIFPSGTIDPWHALGVRNSTESMLPSPSEHALYITGTAHCNDLYAPNGDTDPQSLTNARLVIADQVTKWIG